MKVCTEAGVGDTESEAKAELGFLQEWHCDRLLKHSRKLKGGGDCNSLVHRETLSHSILLVLWGYVESGMK